MDVKGSSFRSHLPSILAAISRAHFVSFDLELSGIPGQQRGQSRAPGQSGAGKQTLQERYDETKKAAERYQVLQLGLTCVEEDRDRGVYILRPYNFFLNPIPDKKLDVERDCTFQSGAVGFLLNVGFRIDAPFLEGVPYFSREEEAQARATAAYRRDRNNYADISVKEYDTESIEFIEGVKHEVRIWKNQGMPEGYLNIAPVNHYLSAHTRGLNGFQKRLVHQLIRSEFPDIVSLSKNDCVQLLPYDQKREDASAERKNFWFEHNLTNQIGLRWVAEALCPTVNEVLPPQLGPPNAARSLTALRGWNYPTGTMSEDEHEACDSRFNEVLMQLTQKMTVLVGHNVFLDLIYFYSCFFGSLPDRVEDFQHTMRHLFPMVFDTKYLADKINNNSASYNSSLEDLDRELSKLPLPVIEVPPGHSKYASDSPVHEAGFDSFLTAKVLIRLAARIGAETPGDITPPSEDDTYVTAPEYGTLNLSYARSYIEQPIFQQRSNMERGNPNTRNEDGLMTFSHTNPYAMLQDPSVDDSQHVRLDQAASNIGVPTSRLPTHTMMPHGDSSFWHRYGNKLRVNGTVEEVCVIW